MSFSQRSVAAICYKVEPLTVRGLGNRKNELFQQRAREDGVEAYPGSVRYLRAVRDVGLRRAVVSSSANCHDALAGVAAGRAGDFGFVVGVDRVGQAEALKDHGADVVVTDLAELMEQP